MKLGPDNNSPKRGHDPRSKYSKSTTEEKLFKTDLSTGQADYICTTKPPAVISCSILV